MNVRLRAMPVLVLAASVPVLLPYAGISKVLAFGEFRASLDRFVLLPEWTHSLALAVPALESISLAVLAVGRPALANFVGAALVAALTSLLAAHIFIGVDPGCSCFGRAAWLQGIRESATDGVIQNAVLIVLAVAAGIIIRRAPDRPEANPASAS